ncbi:hypothetical protein ABTX81_30275 [Kitasatospora sp. NPDC097605]|uniref:hypothetical protein n=1 Tax=Kitasatospora sp. NPDC097605 TaxID=3157226 RepID=UPI003326E45F
MPTSPTSAPDLAEPGTGPGRHPAHHLLTAGLAWLYDTEQPDGAILQHHGAHLGTHGNRRYSVTPTGAVDLPVLVVDIADPDFDFQRQAPRNVLAPGELAVLAAALTRLGAEVRTTWNGTGITGSVGLRRPAHPTLVAAVDRYRARCPTHHSVFCGREQACTWYATGNALITRPTPENPS